MKTLTNLPDLGKSFSVLKIQDNLLGCDHKSVFADVIRENAAGDIKGTIQMCADQIKDNRRLMIDIIGEQTVILIEKLYS